MLVVERELGKCDKHLSSHQASGHQMSHSIQLWQSNSGFILPGGDRRVQMDTKPFRLPGHRSQTALQVDTKIQLPGSAAS